MITTPHCCYLHIFLGIFSGANHNVIHIDNLTLPLPPPYLFLLPLCEYGNVKTTQLINLIVRDNSQCLYPIALNQWRTVNISRLPSQVAAL